MEEEWFLSDEDNEMTDLVKLYEDSKANKRIKFFDVSDFESIINYYIEIHSFNSAFEVVSHATKQHPHSSSIQLKKAQILIERRQPSKSMRILRDIEVLESGNPDFFLAKGAAYSLMGNITKALKSYNNAVESDVENKEEVLYGIALSLQHQNFFKESVNFLEKAAQLNPGNDRYLYELGFAHEKMGDTGKSINYFSDFLDKDPFSESAWFRLGMIYDKLGKKEKALEAFDFALAVNTENFVVILHKANILVQQEKYTEALAEYMHYEEIEYDGIDGLMGIAYCYERLGEYDLAEKYYKKTVDEEPDYAEGWDGLAGIAFDRNNFEESLLYLKKAIKFDPDNMEYKNLLAQIMNNLGE